MEARIIISALISLQICCRNGVAGSNKDDVHNSVESSNKTPIPGESPSLNTLSAVHEDDGGDYDRRVKFPAEWPGAEDEMEEHVVETRLNRFYYCGPKNRGNSCRSLCYAMGYPRHECGRISCYCTF